MLMFQEVQCWKRAIILHLVRFTLAPVASAISMTMMNHSCMRRKSCDYSLFLEALELSLQGWYLKTSWWIDCQIFSAGGSMSIGGLTLTFLLSWRVSGIGTVNNRIRGCSGQLSCWQARFNCMLRSSLSRALSTTSICWKCWSECSLLVFCRFHGLLLCLIQQCIQCLGKFDVLA